MTNYYFLMAALGIGMGVTILLLVRRDHLYIRQGLFWVVIAIVSTLLGIWPSLIDSIGALVGVAYPPALLFLVATVVLVVRALLTDIALTQIRRDVRRLNQRIALSSPDDSSGTRHTREP